MAYNNKSVGPLKISEATYNKQNRKMRKENPGMGSKLTSGTSPRRISFACRFGSMQGDMKDKDGSPSKLAKALKNGVLVVKKLLETFVENIKSRNYGR